ncbi:MAG TPA: hypothetical protein VMR29_10800 [Candidatus Binatia bacterium]|nr:hypothetical protein [Candidatus Binatia bacterium]
MKLRCKPGAHVDRPLKRGSVRVKCERCGDVFPCHHDCEHIDCRLVKNQPLPDWISVTGTGGAP